MISYIGLHNHTDASNFRLLDCCNKLPQLVKKAQELGLGGIAITDHESLSNHVKAIQIQKKLQEEDSNFKIILGDESYLVDSIEEVRDNYKSGVTRFFHFIFLAKDAVGHRQLREISSVAWSNSFYTGKMERVPITKKQVEDIIGDDKGHLIFQTACIGGELAWHILNNDKDKILEFIDWCQTIALPENFYLEMQPNDEPGQARVNKTIVTIGEQLNIKTIITTDCHYLTADMAKIHEAYLNSRDDESRETSEFYRSCYLMDSDEIHKWMDKQIGADKVDEALNNTIEIANKIEFFDLYYPTIVPGTPVPEFEVRNAFKDFYEDCPAIAQYAVSENVYDRYLLKLIEDGFQKKIPYNTLSDEEIFEMVQRIDIELNEMALVTQKLGTSISSYYITTLDLVDLMWNEGGSIVGVARGSVTGMFTMYLIGITQINPLPYNLKHWRHISASKVELSDVDLDSAASKRPKIIEEIKKKRGYDRVLNCCTFKTEGPKSAILSCCRGMGISVEESSYIANLIPVTRGFTWSIADCLYGNEEEGREPITAFKNECEKYEGLIEAALSIEGLICGRSIHASAVYLFNGNYLDHNAMMKAPNGLDVTQFNMKDSDYCSGLKMDELTVKAIDKIQTCMELLVDKGYMEWQGSLRATYDKYLHPDVLDYDSPEMWDAVGEGKITNLFQFDTNIGKQAIQKIKPRSLVDLATSSTIMRLMVSEEGAEQPMDTYVRYKNNIEEWYSCMRNDYHLTEEEIKVLEKYLLSSFGLGPTQEDVMQISMDEKIAGFDVKESNLLRKGISKKDKNLQHKMKDMFFNKGHEKGASDNILNYVWKEVVGKQLGYSFSINHTTPYACISLQQMNLWYHYPPVFWATSCLTINAGADEEVEDNKSTQYGKIGIATVQMKKDGIVIANPDINTAQFSFDPDVEHNAIIYALKAINGIGDDVCRAIIANRPYTSFKDFCTRMIDTKLVKNSQMIMLIKAGCFLKLHSEDREKTMKEYLYHYKYKKTEKLTLSQLNNIKEFGILPSSLDLPMRMLNFKEYVLHPDGYYKDIINPDKKIPKCGYHDRWYILDDEAQKFFTEHFTENSIASVDKNGYYIVSEKRFTKEVETLLKPLRKWFESKEAVNAYNAAVFKSIWEKYASGTEAKWSMQALTYYDQEHELDYVNEEEYGIINFFELPENPEPYEYYTRSIDGELKEFPKYKISRIVGTVLDTTPAHHTVNILTKYGLVDCKFYNESFSYYNRRISGEKSVLEDSWFKRGTLLAIVGYRRGDQLAVKNYQDTIFKHTVNRILEVHPDGTLTIQQERVKA